MLDAFQIIVAFIMGILVGFTIAARALLLKTLEVLSLYYKLLKKKKVI